MSKDKELDGKDLSIFAPVNKYGFKIAINHPQIRPLYEKFKKHKKITIPSNRERLEFEAIIFHLLGKSNDNQADSYGEVNNG